MRTTDSERILLVHLVANGDCLMATTVARQIKADFPGCHLTWAIGYKCRHVIDNNPYVDDIWSVDYAPNELPHAEAWWKTKALAERRRAKGDFTRVYYTQIFPENFNNFDGTTRTTILRSYPGKITVPVSPVIRLYQHEVDTVSRFAESHELRRHKNVIIFECAPGSGQSPLTPELALAVARRVVQARDDTAFVLSSHHRFSSGHPRIIDGSVLSFRENAELSKHATLLLGGSSGLTWLMTSEWSNRLPTIQFLQEGQAWYSFASVKYDHRFFKLPHDHILETDLKRESDIGDLVSRYLESGSFTGLVGRDFRPSLDQVQDLHEMIRSGLVSVRAPLELKRILANFGARNPDATMDLPRFYGSLALRTVRRRGSNVLRRMKRLALAMRQLYR